MIRRILLSMLISSIALASTYYLVDDISTIPDFYAKNIRGSLFSGFLTMGSFLLSLKAFIVVKLKENVFDSKPYKDNLAELKKINPDLTLYGPLRRLSLMIFLAIVSAIAASILQLTLGLINNWVATLVCLFVAVFAISMLICALILIKSTLDQWLDCLEAANNE